MFLNVNVVNKGFSERAFSTQNAIEVLCTACQNKSIKEALYFGLLGLEEEV